MLERVHQDARHPRQHAVDDEARRVGDQHRALAQLLGNSPCGGKGDVIRIRCPDELDERQDRNRVEEVEADIRSHLLDRERGRVRGEDAFRCDDRAELREHLLLHLHVLENGLEHQVAVREGFERGRSLDRAPGVLQLGADRLDGAIDDLLLQVTDDERHAEALEEERRELRRHQPGPDDPDLLHVTGLSVGQAGPALGTALDEVVRVQRRLRLAAEQQVGDRLLLGAVPLLDRPARRPFDQVERAVGSGSGAVDRVVELVARLAGHLVQLREVGRVALHPSALGQLDREGERLVDELDGFEQPVGESRLERLWASQHAVLPQRVLDEELDRGLRIDEPGDELRSAPAGDDPEEALGQGKVANCTRNGSRVAVERDLDAAAQAGPVDRRHGRERERPDPSEQVVPGAAAGDRLLSRGNLRKLVDVGARAEDEGLTGEQHRRPVARLELGDNAVRRLERRATQHGRLRVVGAVVHRHKRDRPHPGLYAVEVEARLRHVPTGALLPFPSRRRGR